MKKSIKMAIAILAFATVNNSFCYKFANMSSYPIFVVPEDWATGYYKLDSKKTMTNDAGSPSENGFWVVSQWAFADIQVIDKKVTCQPYDITTINNAKPTKMGEKITVDMQDLKPEELVIVVDVGQTSPKSKIAITLMSSSAAAKKYSANKIDGTKGRAQEAVQSLIKTK